MMRRVPSLVELSRREFCALGALGAGAVLVGCTDGGLGAVQTGPLGGGDDDTSPPDALPDGGVGPDAPPSATCATGAIDVGAASTYVVGTPKLFSSSQFFVVRDAGGMYALSSACTHEGKTCDVQSMRFHCPRHNALFTLNGAVISGPVSQPLKHYSMCTLANGNLGVTKSTTVPATTRLVV